MSFASCLRSNKEVEAWLCSYNIATGEEINFWFSTQNYVVLQERLNYLAGMKEAWEQEFVQFLGITDKRVQQICECD